MKPNNSEKCYDYVERRIRLINGNFFEGQEETDKKKVVFQRSARLANLRRGIGKAPGEIPELWGEYLEELYYENDLNDKNTYHNEYLEWAIYLSLTLYALHQQGKSENVHSKNISLGTACRNLASSISDDVRVLRRLKPIFSARDMNELSYHLRSLVQLFRARDIKLDYAQLAKDLLLFQTESNRQKVQLDWGRDFYKVKGVEEK